MRRVSAGVETERWDREMRVVRSQNRLRNERPTNDVSSVS